MENVYNYLSKLLKLNDIVVAAISGGPDSMCLLNLLIEIKAHKNTKIICAHVNHNVRLESKEEAIFVKDFCEKNNVIFEQLIIENYNDTNFHNQARKIRYDFFEQLVYKYNAKYLFTAHHGDDLVETILMRLVRGSNLKGYQGFNKQIQRKDYQLIRPLITVTKNDILSYLKQYNLEYVTDESNSKDKYTRNRFRKIGPILKQENKNVHLKFHEFSQTIDECCQFISDYVNKIINEIYINNILNIEKFSLEKIFIQKQILQQLLDQIYKEKISLITSEHVDNILKLASSFKQNAKLNLPNNIVAIKEYNKLYFTKNEEIETYCIELKTNNILPNGNIIAKEKESLETNNYVTYLNSQELKLPLYIRNRTTGDTVCVKGMQGHKKVNDIFKNSKLSKKERDTCPLVVDSNNQIVWLPGIKKTKFDKTKGQNYDIILKYYQN